MALKRSGEDQHRTKLDECTNQEKILSTVDKSMKSVEEEISIYKRIIDDCTNIASFLAMTDYFYSKQDESKMKFIKSISKNLSVPFELIMKYTFDCEFNLDEHAEIVWILNDRSIVIQDDKDEFIASIQKKYSKCQVIRNPKDLE